MCIEYYACKMSDGDSLSSNACGWRCVREQGLKDRGYTLQDNEAEQLVSHLDTDTNGTVDYLDWLAAMVDWHKASPCCAFANLQQGNAAWL